MAKETKVGLLVGMGIIFLIAWVVGDHLSVVRTQTSPDLTPFADQAQQNIQHALGATGPGQPVPPGQPGGQVAVGGGNRAVGAAAGDFGAAAAGQDTAGGPAGSQAAAGQADGTGDGRTIPLPGEAQQPRPRQNSPLQEGSPLAQQFAQRVDDATGRDPIATQQSGGAPVGDALRSDNAQPTRLGPQPQRIMYDVQPGDSLWSIAQKFYNDGGRWQAIQAANPTAVPANGAIHPGARLVIPEKSAVLGPLPPDRAVADLRQQIQDRVIPPPGAGPSRGPQAQNAPAGNEIRVEKGDTLSGLAQKHLGSSRNWQQLLDANRDKLAKPEDLREGMVLLLPVGATRVAAAGASTTSASTHAGAHERTGAAPPQAQRAAASAARPAATRGARTYRVKARETLQSIAARELGDAGRWKEIYQANIEQIDNPDRVEAGLTLIIP